MTADRKRLTRLRRLEKVRALAKDQAAREAAAAEGTLAQLNALVARTRCMTADYRGARPADGLALRQIGLFVSGLEGIAQVTTENAEQARALADRKQAELIQAERRRAVVSDRLDAVRLRVTQPSPDPVPDRRSPLGTVLE